MSSKPMTPLAAAPAGKVGFTETTDLPGVLKGLSFPEEREATNSAEFITNPIGDAKQAAHVEHCED